MTMKMKSWLTYLFWILVIELIGSLSGWLTADGVRIWQLMAVPAPLTPPGYVFPVVWGILYGLMGFGLARIRMGPESGQREKALGLFRIQLFLNFFWSLIFFTWQAYRLAFMWLAVMFVYIVKMIRAFWELDRPAALLQIPYLIWTLFALYLNLAVAVLN